MRPGTVRNLKIVKTTEHGVYLSDGSEEKVLLPKKEVPETARKGSELSVFLYLDSEDRLIATVREPVITLNQTALLTVVSVTKIGAFLDWGLEKDLFLPFAEQTYKVRPGDQILAALYTDKSGRLCATMRLYKYLKNNAPYGIGDTLKARVYDIIPKFGVYVAVEDTYSGLIPKREAQGNYVPGSVLDVRVTRVHEDGRLDVSPRAKAYKQMKTDAEMILDRLRDCGGRLDFDDRADPELINAEFGISKAAFKRAVGRLLKEKLIVIRDGRIHTN